MSTMQLRIPSLADHIDIVRLCLYGIASKMGFTYEDIEDMKVAVSEACNNAILHQKPDDKLGMIDISFEMEDAALSIIIKDNGPGFDYEGTLKEASPLRGTEVADLRIGGLGIYLMQALMDRVEVISGSGTVVNMTKYKRSAHTAEEL
jgi:serine/threonine-protein kinase RsbW